jgi:GDPmannose 4,6-dehydratase
LESAQVSTKTAVVTGVSGQDGSYLADLLLEKGYKVVGIIRRTAEYERENLRHLKGRMIFEYGDLMDSSSLDTVIDRYKPQEVYNLAAQSIPADSWSRPFETGDITALGAVRMLEAVRRFAPEARFYQATSREIVGGVEQEVVNEDTPLRANNPYGVAKLYAHLMTQVYRESYGMFTCAGILFNHESPRRGLHFVSRKVTMAAACVKLGIKDVPVNEAGEPLVSNGRVAMGNLDAMRDWGYAPEYVEAMWLMLQNKKPTDYIIATNTMYSVRDLCRVAFAHVGLNWENHVDATDRFRRPTEITDARGDYSAAERDLGWKPRTFFEDIVKQMVDADLKRLTESGRAR